MPNRVRTARALARLLVVLAGAGLAYGQGSGTIVGTITDPTGAVIPSAKITAADEATSISRETVTNGQGYYVIPSLRPSTYTVTVHEVE